MKTEVTRMSTLQRYQVTVPGKGKTRVRAYAISWAAQQGCNVLGCSDRSWAWVRPMTMFGRLLKAERVHIYHGIGRG